MSARVTTLSVLEISILQRSVHHGHANIVCPLSQESLRITRRPLHPNRDWGSPPYLPTLTEMTHIGSILSPILFLIYVNDVSSSLLHGKLVQYADDTTLCFTSKSKLILEQQSFIEINNCV
ncbi:hypothetical protein J6590_099593 [Homalodisca vitripennis]|nr:hypothetical protein J6590_099593 [Homalodisca vitripennis]